MRFEQCLDLAGSGLAKAGDRAPPAAPTRYAHGQVRERCDAVGTQHPHGTGREPLLNIVRNLRLRHGQRTQDFDTAALARVIRSLTGCSNSPARSGR